MVPPAIRIENLHYAYPATSGEGTSAPALQGIDLVVEAGEFLTLMGPMGAGKTTLCLALNGLVPQSTGGNFRGDVWVAGRNTKKAPVAELATEVGVVFQDAEGQLFNMTVEDEIAFGPESLGLPIEEIERRIQWALGVVGLAEMRTRSPAHLSGGQQRRLAIAAVLALKPAILVLDEPTEGLDPLARRAVMTVISELRSQGTTVVMATQDVDAVAGLTDRVIVLDSGHVYLEGTAQQILGQIDKLNALGVNAPQMVELSHHLGLHPPCLTVDQAFQALSGNRFSQLAGNAQDQPPESLWRKSSEKGPVHQPMGSQAQQTRTTSSEKDKPAALSVIEPSDQASVTFQDVWYQYDAGAQALTEIDLALSSGEYVALIGANGSGKSTLAKHAIGLLRPQQGSVLVANLDTREKSTGELARWVGYVFQNPDHQIFAPSVWDEIAFGPHNLGLDRAEVEKRVQTALLAFDLTPLANLPPAVLGYGQRRLVTLAAVHAMQPHVLILDEPTVGLDRHYTTKLMDWVSELHKAGSTILLITHNMRLVSQAPRCILMNHGRIILDTRPAQVFGQAAHLAEAGITPPPLIELSRRLNLPLTSMSTDVFVHNFVRSI